MKMAVQKCRERAGVEAWKMLDGSESVRGPRYVSKLCADGMGLNLNLTTSCLWKAVDTASCEGVSNFDIPFFGSFTLFRGPYAVGWG